MSFTIAAKILGVSQSTVSKYIAALENELGLKLFNRNGKSLSLTESGSIIYRDFKLMLSSIDATIQHAKSVENRSERSIKVGVMRNLDIPKVSRNLLTDFFRNNPDVKVDFLTGKTSELIYLCKTGAVDCIFTLDRTEEPEHQLSENLNSLVIYDTPIRIIYNRSIFPDSSQPTIDELSRYPLICIKADTGRPPNDVMIEKLEKGTGLHPASIITVENFQSLWLNVQMGQGIGLVPFTIRLPSSNSIIGMEFANIKTEMSVFFTWRHDNTNPTLGLLINEMTLRMDN